MTEYWILYTLLIDGVNRTMVSAAISDHASRLCAGERAALARALTLAERNPEQADALLASLPGACPRARVFGLTGPPGAGKSSLVGSLLPRLAKRGLHVGVLAVDPSSPFSGGALLGDRCRMGDPADEDHWFIRSTASRGSLGGLNPAIPRMVALLEAAGFDIVLVETVGAGQADIDIARLADTVVVACPPGLGDELQALKAGILELADLLVVTKCDGPAAMQTLQSLQAALRSHRSSVPVMQASSHTGEGLEALLDTLLDLSSRGPKPLPAGFSRYR